MINIGKIILGMVSRECPICKETYWRIIRSESSVDEQNKTIEYKTRYICQKCGAEEEHSLEFSESLIKLYETQ